MKERTIIDRSYGNTKKKIFSFDKVAYWGKRKIHEVTLEITLYKDRNGYPEFTASADVWNNLHTDIVAGGQMIDDLYNDFPRFRSNTIYLTIKELWERYHLKDVTAIPEIDKNRMDILFSDLERSEIIAKLKELK